MMGVSLSFVLVQFSQRNIYKITDTYIYITKYALKIGVEPETIDRGARFK
jgi:hypothetical protein